MGKKIQNFADAAQPAYAQTPQQPLLAFTDQAFLRREELQPFRIQLELLRPELILKDHQIEHAVVFFGSARIPNPEQAKQQWEEATAKLAQEPHSPVLQAAVRRTKRLLEHSAYLEQATTLANLIANDESLNWAVFTGGGPGFMEAANKGAYLAQKPSVALNVLLPTAQTLNPYITPGLTFQFHYFSINKMHFLIRAKALVAFPGGFGTLNEIFEALTLIQTQKIAAIPLILFNQGYWERIINFKGLVEEGTIAEKDLKLMQYAETAEQAWDILHSFYQTQGH